MNQEYYCNHCGIRCESIFAVFLHIFTDHFHTDIGLCKDESLRMVNNTSIYKTRFMAWWPN